MGKQIDVKVFEGGEEVRSYTKFLDKDDLTFFDILHYGTTGLRDEEMRYYVVVSPNGIEVSLHAKIGRIEEIWIYPICEIYPSEKLPWARAMIINSKKSPRPNDVEVLRHLLASFGAEVEVLSPELGMMNVIMHRTEVKLVVVSGADILNKTVDPILGNPDNKWLAIWPMDTPDEVIKSTRANIKFKLAEDGFGSIFERGRLIRLLANG